MSSGQGWQFGGLSVRHRTDSAITLWKSEGVVSAEALAGSLERCQGHIEAKDSGALVACYLDADMQLEPDGVLQKALHVVGDGGALSLPTALVVPADTVTFWRTYAALMANAGIVRAVFTDPERAARWAIEQAAVARAERAFRRRSQAAGR